MGFGIFCGLSAAVLNSTGYIFGARFLLHYRSAFRLTAVGTSIMMVPCLPLMFFLFPYEKLLHNREFLLLIPVWILVYWLGQGSFFIALTYFKSSCLSSFLGLKIVILALIYLIFEHKNPGMWQWAAVILAAGAAVSFNWSGANLTSPAGMVFLLTTLIGFSLCDIVETRIMQIIQESGYSLMRSSVTAVVTCYSVLGVVSLPLLFYLRLTRRQIVYASPYALIWIASQIMLCACFVLLLPVFANVILATRGIFSVLLGALLAAVGLSKFDSSITRAQWIKRGISACAMIIAIAVYSMANAGILK